MPPKAVDALEPLHPEPALSRPWAAPTESVAHSHPGGASTIPVGGGHAPESGRCPGSAPPGTGAFAAMGSWHYLKDLSPVEAVGERGLRASRC
jgi:hypothetical protein